MSKQLSQIASEIMRISREHAEAFEYDCLFDGGEFSGPASARSEEREIKQAIADAGWTIDDFESALVARTTPGWVYRYFPILMSVEPDNENY